MEIGEPFLITDVYSVLNTVPGVVDTTQVTVSRAVGGAYSTTPFDVEAATSPDGRFINVPRNAVLELKFPSDNIRGSVI